MIKLCPSFELAHSSLSKFCPTMNIGLFNGDDLFLIDQVPLVNDHVRAFIDARILLIGHGRIVSAERSTIIDRVRAVSVSGGRVFGGALNVDFEAAFQVAQP